MNPSTFVLWILSAVLLSLQTYQTNSLVPHTGFPLAHTVRSSLISSSITTTSNCSHSDDETALSQRHAISYRSPSANDIASCLAIESASYPPDEAATLESLTYRQANAGDYFQCAVINNNDDNNDNAAIIGFVCATRCDEFAEESMSTHSPDGPLLAIHSVVVEESFRRQGIATAMLQAYLEKVEAENSDTDGSIESVVLLAKEQLLDFYRNCGFQVNGPSSIVHGEDLWYELEKRLD
ncbi:Aralkylamine N-acetyltransferase [Seminavis robusta]|uniref:Aralkylamine N-acetyltransferase n=1 Tax=Seminavis robusta TaxID=568900 RepID=A0A9N8DMI3_9STRA|nr:Aralkylamine N-acetyltransferase [Seminavis robusta]|eukprot:Sro137_g064510.1 Aralkylamine N-acetyltransferase (238) ;mRNA; f:86349-87062